METPSSARRFDLHFNFTPPGRGGGSLSLWAAEPVSQECQEILDFRLSVPPLYSYADPQGNRIHYLELESGGVLEMEITALLWQDADRLSLSSGGDFLQGVSRRFLEEEAYLEYPEAAREFVKDMPDRESLGSQYVESLARRCAERFTYQYPVLKRGVGALDFKNLRGDCGEMSGLLVSLCRALGLPARNQTGVVIYPEERSVQEHGWASVWSGKRWADCDVQYASLEENLAKGPADYILRRSDYRLTVCNGFNLPLLKAENEQVGQVQVLQPVDGMEREIERGASGWKLSQESLIT